MKNLSKIFIKPETEYGSVTPNTSHTILGSHVHKMGCDTCKGPIMITVDSQTLKPSYFCPECEKAKDKLRELFNE